MTNIDFTEMENIFMAGNDIREVWYKGERLWYFWQVPTNSTSNLFDPSNQKIGRLDHNVGNPWGVTKLTAYATEGWRTISPIQVKPNTKYSLNSTPEWVLLYNDKFIATRLIKGNQTITTAHNEVYLGAYTVFKDKKLDGFVVSEGGLTPIYYTAVSGDSWWRIWDKNRATAPTLDDIYKWNNANASTVIHAGDRVIVGYK